MSRVLVTADLHMIQEIQYPTAPGFCARSQAVMLGVCVYVLHYVMGWILCLPQKKPNQNKNTSQKPSELEILKNKPE